MEGREFIRIKIERIESYVKIVNAMKEDCLKKFLSDPIYQGALLHYLYLIADSCLSLAEMIIKEKGLRTPQSYAEAIDILGENNVIPPDFAYHFSKIASFRNFLAHDYESVDYLFICKEALNKTPEIVRYLNYVKKYTPQ